jgi:hypothetical protein
MHSNAANLSTMPREKLLRVLLNVVHDTKT